MSNPENLHDNTTDVTVQEPRYIQLAFKEMQEFNVEDTYVQQL